jgi:chromosome segregation ATPase
MNPTAIKDWAELAALVLGWIISLFIAVNKLIGKINGVGAKVNSLEVTVGQHETKIDNVETEQGIARRDRTRLFEDVGEFRAEVANLNKTCRESDEKNNKLLTEIQVNIGRLDTKVDILLKERKT